MGVIITVGSRYKIEGLSRDRADEIKNDLTLSNPVFVTAEKYSGLHQWQINNIPKYLIMYDDINGSLYVPRGYAFPELKTARVIDKRNFAPFEEPLPECLITPKAQQRKALDVFDKERASKRPYGNYMNVLEVAAGKTILAALMARELGQRTIIFVHTQLIMSVWIKDLCKMFGDDYKKQIGIIRGPEALVGPHFTIAMSQTWTRRQENWAEWNKLFGCCIFDESHVCPRTTFKEIVNRSPAAYRIGITGTPKRKDKMHKIMYLVFGTAFYDMKQTGLETSTSMPVTDVNIVRTKSMISGCVKKNIYAGKYVKEIEAPIDTQRDYMRILDMIARDGKRTLLIAKKVVHSLMSSRNNSVVIATHRVEHAWRIKEMINALWSGEVAMLIGAAKDLREKEILLRERRIRCAVATIQLFKTGASIEPLNRLFIATTIGGTGDLEQLVGRVRRKCEGKDDVFVYHVVDWNIPMCRRHFNTKALPYYRDKLHVPRFKNFYIA